MVCSYCGYENKDTAKFCGNCGKKIQASPKYCPECGTVVEEAGNFCLECGTHLTDIGVCTINVENTSINKIEDELEELQSSELQYRGNGEIKNKIIHFDSQLTCSKSLHFIDCTIYYNEQSYGNEIVVQEGARLSIKNSTVICKGYSPSPFISCDDGVSVEFVDSKFIDCSYFLYASNDATFKMKGCELSCCYDGFVEIHAAENHCSISDTRILQGQMNSFYFVEDRNSHPILISIDTYGDQNVDFYNNTIVEEPVFREISSDLDYLDNLLCYFSCDEATVRNCSFTGISRCIDAPWVTNCTFKDCLSGIKTRSCNRNRPSIDGCSFENCTKSIVADERTIVRACTFTSCQGCLISGHGIRVDSCQFRNVKKGANDISNEFGILAFETFSPSVVNNCTFDGVELHGRSYLIAAENGEKPSGVFVTVRGCSFRNCSTTCYDGVIRQFIEFYGAFTTLKEYKKAVVDISDCVGLDRVRIKG